MHKATRQIWATSSSSSSSSSCLFCDFQQLIALPPSARARSTITINPNTHIGARPFTGTRVQSQLVLEQQQRLETCLRIFGIDTYPQFLQYQQRQLKAVPFHRLLRLRRQNISTYSTGDNVNFHCNTIVYNKGPSRTRPEALHHQPHPQLSSLVRPMLVFPAPSGARLTVSVSSRFLSSSTTASMTSNVEAELSALPFTASTSATPATSASAFPANSSSPLGASTPILDLSTALKESSTTDFQTLFPSIPESFAEPSLLNLSTIKQSEAPWRNSLMAPGSELEESLRKSLYQRDPISIWWPLYEQTAKQWRMELTTPDRNLGNTALGREDFIRLIGALKLSPFSSGSCESVSSGLMKLELIFEDFHHAIKTPKSNHKVYSLFLDTLNCWKMREQIPTWIERIKSKIIISNSSSPSIREGPQEQYHDLMRVLADASQIDALLTCLQELKTNRSGLLRPTVKAYDTAIEAYMKCKDIASAMKLVREMQDYGYYPQLTTYNILIRGHLVNKDGRAAQRVLESLLLTDIRPNIYTFNLLMSGYLNLGEIELVNGFYKGLGEYGLVPNSKTYRILMKSYLRQGQLDQVIGLFHKLKESPQENLHPRSEDYRVLILALASHGRMPDALRVLRELTETTKAHVTAPIYNVFLNQYARQGQVEKARRVLNRIIAEKLPLVDGSINPLLRAYLAQKDFEKVEEMIQLMNSHGIRSSKTTFNIMLDYAKNSRNLRGAMDLYKRMMDESVEPDVWTYNTILNLLVDKLSPLERNIMRKDDSNAVTDEQIKEFVPKIDNLLQEMKSRGIKPDVVTYGTLIRQYVVLRDIEQAEMLFHEMVKSGISPNSNAFNMLMNGFTIIDEMDKAVELFRRMPKYGVKADVVTFTTLIKGYANLKQITLAQDFANSLQQQRPVILMDKYCLHTLMQLAQKSNQPGMALDFFEMMRSRGMKPDKVTFTILVNSLSKEFANTYTGSSNKSKPGSHDRSKRIGDRYEAKSKGSQAESASHAIESILEVIQKDSYPLSHAEITTMISGYFRLGRPLAAIEFFKASFWGNNPKLNATNCGAFIHGLLSPEHEGRFDGIALNLYSRMLSVTREKLKADEREEIQWREETADSREGPTSTDRLSWAPPNMYPSLSRQFPFKPKAGYSYDLPMLDLVIINILFQSFSERKNWNIVLQLWKDLESVGAENLYPYELPRELLGWAAQAYYNLNKSKKASSQGCFGSLTKSKASENSHESIEGEDAVSYEDNCKRMLKRLWNEHQKMGITWSIKIYGYNIFESVPSPSSGSSSSPPSSRPQSTMASKSAAALAPLSSLSSPQTSASAWTHLHSTSLLTSYMSVDTMQQSYHQERVEVGNKGGGAKDQ
ncbi:hypothetical protein BCR41DRAFT_424395 [Lobosporangium transversale]|uniref:Pentacotripeptide-repeat region of PRORP domain-containing protein n=1 Tax=Lobosporangium transversale TaxID=64571 RepID=A0A1Y2GEU4_9FUNG|nr:hypothetical protein BCR41DRAFT_424395 [Lobosporangium transversale]ORZ08821.1 hypothetical protein BCR41DRAFT_424395 [Lobosporangium transversale]|eukprot:XP_021878604.1 hypothetical protein BCR41DRAFT_424395 [Lobosporangium transversale]